MDNVHNKLQVDESKNKFSLTTMIKDGVDQINNNMLEFSNNIMNTEVTEHD
jgi:hypothetical protein